MLNSSFLHQSLNIFPLYIIETGLRPGEKLYEELLIRTEEMDKTENDLIFIERDKPLSEEEINEKLDVLRAALSTGHNTIVKEALMKVVPTYHTPEEVNEDVEIPVICDYNTLL